jgi:carbamoyltransferase
VRVLGINDGHGASACVVEDGRVIAAIQEERLSGVKNQGGTPTLAVERTLRDAGIELPKIDQVAISSRRMRHTGLYTSKDVLAGYRAAFRPDHHEKGFEDQAGQQDARAAFLTDLGYPRERVCFVDHHSCHAASAYFGRGAMDRDILVLTSDGHGDGLSGTVSIGREGRIRRLASLPGEDSIAALYSYVTFLLGFTPLEHEYKLMGMAPYAEESAPAAEVRDYFDNLFEFREEQPLQWLRRPGVPPTPLMASDIESAMRFRRFDAVMAGLQLFVERIVCAWVTRVVAHTGVTDLALSGGLFMNVKLNQRISELPSVRSAFFCPSAGDESNCIGAAWAAAADDALHAPDSRPLPDLYLGSEYSDAEVEAAVERFSFVEPVHISRPAHKERQVAQLLADNNVVARFSGRMEFGARALGNRSILANPSDPSARTVINRMIKHRDFWMPFAPTILADNAGEYLEGFQGSGAEYMMLSFNLKEHARDCFQAAAHPHDWTCRPQVLSREANLAYYRIISEFRSLTGIGGVLNTSFNLHGEPIVESPQQALDVFSRSGLGHLMLGPLLVEKD